MRYRGDVAHSRCGWRRVVPEPCGGDACAKYVRAKYTEVPTYEGRASRRHNNTMPCLVRRGR